MKNFFLKIVLFVSPILLLLIYFSVTDVFKFFGVYDNYYNDSFVGINREHVCFETYKKNRTNVGYNSFIFGSSRSKSFRTIEWKKFLSDNSIPFHFDASGEGIHGISDKIAYIDKTGDTIKKALVIIDRTILNMTHSRAGHLFIPNPEISGDSKVNYYTTIFKAEMNPKFAIAYIDYSIFREYRPYMGKFILKDKYKDRHDPISCDSWNGKDQEIKEDSIGYYQSLVSRNILYDRPSKNKINVNLKVTDLEVEQLKKIQKVFEKHNTDYKIVIAPIYNQIKMEEEQIELLNEIFEPNNVFNYSGVNKYTESKGNYYEASHFKPSVSNDILKNIYTKN